MKTYPNCLNYHFPIICRCSRLQSQLSRDSNGLKSHDLSGYLHSRKCGITGFCYLDGYRQVILALDWLSCTMKGTAF